MVNVQLFIYILEFNNFFCSFSHTCMGVIDWPTPLQDEQF